MKKTVLVLFIITIISFMAGIITTTITSKYIKGQKGNIQKKNDLVSFSENKESDIEGITEICVSGINTDIKLINSNEKNISMIFDGKYPQDTIKPELNIEKNNGKLNIIIKEEKKEVKSISELIKLIDSENPKTSLTISIPDTYNNDISIDTTSGYCKIDNLKINKLDFESVCGDINIDDVKTKETNISTTSGEIEIKSLKGILDISTVSGDIEADDIVSGKAGISTTSGEIEINEIEGNIKLNTVSGDIDIINNYLKKNQDYNIETTSGDVKVKLPSNAEVEVTFRSASGELKNEFKSRKSPLDMNTAKIKVETISGDCKISKSISAEEE